MADVNKYVVLKKRYFDDIILTHNVIIDGFETNSKLIIFLSNGWWLDNLINYKVKG